MALTIVEPWASALHDLTHVPTAWGAECDHVPLGGRPCRPSRAATATAPLALHRQGRRPGSSSAPRRYGSRTSADGRSPCRRASARALRERPAPGTARAAAPSRPAAPPPRRRRRRRRRIAIRQDPVAGPSTSHRSAPLTAIAERKPTPALTCRAQARSGCSPPAGRRLRVAGGGRFGSPGGLQSLSREIRQSGGDACAMIAAEAQIERDFKRKHAAALREATRGAASAAAPPSTSTAQRDVAARSRSAPPPATLDDHHRPCSGPRRRRRYPRALPPLRAFRCWRS